MKTTKWLLAGVAATAAIALAGCSPASGGGGSTSGSGKLTMLIGSSGDAETKAVQDAASAWGKKNSTTVDVVAASDLNQQLSQGFAGDDAPDLFYMGWDQFDTYAANGYLQPYAKDLANKGDFIDTLTKTFTYDNTFTCAPKDSSTLGLIINTGMWQAAGLTDADVPKDWDGLEAAAKKLTTGGAVGLSFGLEYARVGVFMNQAGGTIVDGDKVKADSKENLAGLDYVKKLHDEGVLKFPSEIDSGWSGEALGKGKAAMVIEGPWIKGIQGDYPDTKYAAYELPKGPDKSSTFSFTNCWGIPKGGDNAAKAQSLVEFLTSDDRQMAFADAFGVIPSTTAASKTYADKYPENASFVASADYAVSPIKFDGAATVITDFNSQLEGLATGADPEAMLKSFQTELQSALDEADGK